MILLRILAASQSSKEGFDATYDGLEKEVGVIYHRAQPSTPKTFKVYDENELDPEFDRAGLQALKIKHGV